MSRCWTPTAASSTSDWRTLKRANWDGRTAAHLGPRGHDLSTHRAGLGTLNAIVAAELGPVAGLSALHLQCHTGDDTLPIAQRGAARVVGLDVSPPALDAARSLAGHRSAFDLVFTSRGTIWWLPDLAPWAAAIAHALKSGGRLYLADMHPAAFPFDDAAGTDAAGRPLLAFPCLARTPLAFDNPSDYADLEARQANSRTVEFLHPLSDILGALRGAGLVLDWLHEHPRLTRQVHACLAQGEDRLWTWPDKPWLPRAVSLPAIGQG